MSPSGPVMIGLPSASASAVSPVSLVTTVFSSLNCPLAEPQPRIMSAASTCTPSLHVTPSLTRYVMVNGSRLSIGHVPTASLFVSCRSASCKVNPPRFIRYSGLLLAVALPRVVVELNDSNGSFHATRTSPAGADSAASHGPSGTPQPLPP